MFKKRYLLLGAAVPFVMLNGCAIGENAEDKSVPIEKVDMSRYEKKAEEGLYKGNLNEKFVDINVNGKLKTYYVQKDMLSYLKNLRDGDNVKFIAGINEKTGQNELYSISQINGKDISISKPVKNKLETNSKKHIDNKKENKEKTNMEVVYPKTTKIMNAVKENFFSGKFNVLETYNWDGEILSNGDIEIRFAQIKDTPEDDVQKERWRAADTLKETGDLKEQDETNRKGVKFIFYARSDSEYKEIMVIKNKYGYFRVETDTPKKEKDNVIAELTAMLNSIK
ncbi:hypothetical protein AAGG74_14840 [Bacillus mexicanus]|uniref:hypothetical protein n=1 Tax=Bacillus mexicanus TaxID=2834415 RepID=UPI003D263C1A